MSISQVVPRLLVLLALLLAVNAGSAVLTSLQYKVTGVSLEARPAVLQVPKGIAGSVMVELRGAYTGTNNVHVEAVLRGPSFPARRILGQVNQALLLPPLPLSGDYHLDNIRLVDSNTQQTRLEATPSSIPIRVFEEVLITQVTSRPLTLAEIQERGIAIDETNFRAVEFEVGFVLDGKTIPVRFPVVAPTFIGSTDIIPKAEIEEMLARARDLNREISQTLELPPELEASQLNVQIQGINFQPVDLGEQDLALTIPPIPALLVIPGNIGFLNQFFSVQVFTENGAPGGSGLVVNNLKATLVLPPGPDRVASTNYSQPGDDPLRFARIGPNKIVQPEMALVKPGADGQPGTPDDILRIDPGDSGSAEFLVEGLQEGLHIIHVRLDADLEGLAAGPVRISGKAAGSVLVRNPKFSLAFSHPRTIRAGEPYDASVTILNTGGTPANFVRVTLPSTALSGGVLESPETVELGTLQPGQSGTALFRIRAQRTGSIAFSNLTTSDESTEGRFRLTMGIDERGVLLSPDTIAMPDFTDSLPQGLVAAANRVLGQALSTATAGQLPPGVLKVPPSIITKRVLELAEAGQRLRYGDQTNRVLVDLLLDWQGGRSANEGFAQILSATDAGREFRDSLGAAQDAADNASAIARLASRATEVAGRGENWMLASADPGFAIISESTQATSSVDFPLSYEASRGTWTVRRRPGTNTAVIWQSATNSAGMNLGVLVTGTNGSGSLIRWELASAMSGACYTYPGSNSTTLLVDINCDGIPDSIVQGSQTAVQENPPTVVAVLQDPSVLSGRPPISCYAGPDNYATVLGVLFSKPMSKAGTEQPAAYVLDGGNIAKSVQVQPGGRVALLNMSRPIGMLKPRSMTITGGLDVRGNTAIPASTPVRMALSSGLSVRGRVVRADGTFAASVPVTLTYHDLDGSGIGCDPWTARPSQVFTDSEGTFSFDFVLTGIPYSISATDTVGLPPEAIALLLESAHVDGFARTQLEALLQDAGRQRQALQGFGAATVSEAIAFAEGIDRASIRDVVAPGSAREGTEAVFALRFRGRGIVTGQVFAADGKTPAAGSAVNLFPSSDSRELGRGVFSDLNGRFEFHGVPLGNISIQAQARDRTTRTVAHTLEQPGQILNISIVLSAGPVAATTFRGRVLEPDTTTPHVGARVFIGRVVEDGAITDVVAAEQSDANGFWAATNVPFGSYDVVAVSADGKRKAIRRTVNGPPLSDTFLSMILNGRTTVFGRVEWFNGVPATNALVAGGDTLVRTDSRGLFELTGVPTGERTISAGVEKNVAAGIDFPRLGSEALNVVDGAGNFVVVRLRPAGRIVGRVLDVIGRPVPNARVSIPQNNGFLWVNADSNGQYIFEGLGLDHYVLSAPGPSVAKTDTSAALDKLRGGTEEDIRAAFTEALQIFTGATDPFLTGETFNPSTWGYTETVLSFDGQTRQADIRLLREGTVGGVVLNGQGVPIGAKVRLTGIGPLANGQPAMVVKGDVNSDPANGSFLFRNGIFAGPFGLQAASPFFPVVVSSGGQTTSTDPNSTNNVLQFPATREIAGRLAGVVYYPDGSPVGSNVTVKISFGADYAVRTDTNGFYDTQIGLPEGGYQVEALDPLTGLRGLTSAGVRAGVTNIADVHLLGKGSLEVTVKHAEGTVATNASVTIAQGGFPYEQFTAAVGTNGTAVFRNLFEGSYSVLGSASIGQVTLSSRARASVARESTASAIVVLGPAGIIRGRFVQRNGTTPVGFAQVAVGNIGFTTTDSEGKFEVLGVPAGTYRIQSQHPVTGVSASTTVTIMTSGEIKDVLLVEQARGEVRGVVVNGYGTGFVPGATVELKHSDPFVQSQTVTTGPDGAFTIPGVVAGTFTLEAFDPSQKQKGAITTALPENVPGIDVRIPLEPLARLSGTVLAPGIQFPATNAVVRLVGPGETTRTTNVDAEGNFSFVDLQLGAYQIRADSLTANTDRSAVGTNILVTAAGNAPPIVLVLSGIGTIRGSVRLSDGVSPAVGAEVIYESLSPLFKSQTETTFTDSNGRYNLPNIPLGPYAISARAVALGAAASGMILTNGHADVVDLKLGFSGSITGRLLRADGITPAEGVDVTVQFRSQSGLPGVAVTRADSTGRFEFHNVPVGRFNLEAIASAVNGVAQLAGELLSNGQNLDLGGVLLDEADPRVIYVLPANSADGVPVTTSVDLLFSEAMSTNSISGSGIFLRSGTNTIAARLELLPGTNGPATLVRLTPLAPLASERTYQIVVVDGIRLDPLGNVGASGPQDTVGRPLIVPFIASFTTRDAEPPLLVSVSPSGGTVQVDPASVIRFSFNEPIQQSNLTFSLSGPSGTVPGELNVGLNGLVVTFIPATLLAPNSTYAFSLSDVRDMAGNLASGQPLTGQFATVDTLGPEILALKVLTNTRPVAGSVVVVEALLSTNEAAATVRFTQDLNPAPRDTQVSFQTSVTMPLSGTTVVRAIATDRFGNDGPLAELTLTSIPNSPPAVAMTRLTPASGPLTNGQFITIRIEATDDLSVSNILAMAFGGLSLQTNLLGPGPHVLSLRVPDDVASGARLRFVARATDVLGLPSEEASLEVQVADGLSPTLVLVTPPGGSVLNVGEPLRLVVASGDNAIDHTLFVRLAGAIQSTQTLAVASSATLLATNTFSFSLGNLSPDGSSILATVSALDTSGNASTVTRTFFLADTRPPHLVSVVPTNGAARQSLWLSTIHFNFDEGLSAATIATNRIVVTNNEAVPSPFEVSLAENGTRLNVSLGKPLQPGVSYTNVLLPGFADTSGNLWVDSQGRTIPGDGLAFAFTTAAFVQTSPTNNTEVVAGQPVSFKVEYEPGLGAAFFRFSVNGAPPIQVTAGGTSTLATIAIPTNPGPVTVLISASPTVTFDAPYTLPALQLNAVAPSGDTDNDGMPDEYELTHGLNPRENDGSRDLDGDGLPNFQEFVRGTKPSLIDTDSDGLADNAEVVLGTNPLNPDTDNDGILDRNDPNPFGRDDDQDGDGIADVDDPDIDGDGLSNQDESTAGTHARNRDSDGDGWPDGFEVEAASNPLDRRVIPALFLAGQPEVGFLLPSAPLNTLATNIIVSEPPVGILLPIARNIDPAAFGTILSEPTVGVIIPAPPEIGIAQIGIVLSEPVVAFILPTTNTLSTESFGPLLSDPVVTLRLPTAAGPPGMARQLRALSFHIEDTASSGAERSTVGKTSWVVIVVEGMWSPTSVLESSSDLQTWTAENAEVSSIQGGRFLIRCATAQTERRFYRVRTTQ